MLAGGLDPAYRALLGGGGTFLRRLEVWRGGQRVDSTGDEGVPMLSGTLTANLENRVTRKLDLSLPASLFPASGDLLDPFGSELVLWCGWRGGAGAPYWWPAFTGPVVTVSTTTGDGRMELSALDRAEQIVEDKFLSPVSSGVGRLVTTAIRDLVSDSQPGAKFGQIDETYATVPDLTWEDDRGKAIDDLASGAGCLWFQLPDGRYSVRRIPWAQPSLPPPIVTFTAGVDVTSVTITRSRAGVYTICQVVGEAATGDAPVSGEAYNLDPQSPAYHLGPLGRRVLKVQQDTVASSAQAAGLARQRLRRSGAGSEQVSTRGVYDPALELGDSARIVTEYGIFVRALSSITVSLGNTPMASAVWKSTEEGVEE